jgi:farnesyl diphosphate synthase
MEALAASIASHVPSGLSLVALASPGEIIRRASRLEDELKELLRVHDGRAGAEQGAGGQQNKERFLRAYERLKTELLNDRAFNFDFTEETRQWVAKVRVLAPLAAQLSNVPACPRVCSALSTRSFLIRTVHCYTF